ARHVGPAIKRRPHNRHVMSLCDLCDDSLVVMAIDRRHDRCRCRLTCVDHEAGKMPRGAKKERACPALAHVERVWRAALDNYELAWRSIEFLVVTSKPDVP